ncbi:hypothetical protein KKG31_00180 [Patescibacteria group bacterium]|nr:hypothetical protein [Patescibacteria group bacterium]MBU1757608.1 hypothetical protein [Patescibacteria group bacterium]
MLAIPEPSISGDIIDLFVGKNLDNAILYYVTYDNVRGECYIDADIEVDTNEDGVFDNDHDFNCNQLYLQKYQAKYDGIVGRIYYSKDDLSLASRDFTVSFLDFEVDLSPEMKAVYDDISSLLKTMEGVLWET